MAMFIRVKRKKTTYFLHCDPTETILEIKQKIQALSDNPVDCQRLVLLSSHQILEDNKTLAEQKTATSLKGVESSQAPTTTETNQDLQGVLLEDAKSLAEQKVENDAIVALCLKISDPRVHRIPTLMRPHADYPAPTREDSPQETVEELNPLRGEEALPPPPPPPPEHRMSTELRVPFRPRLEGTDVQQGDKDSSKLGLTSKKNITQKDASKREVPKKDAAKTSKKEATKKENLKKGGDNKSDKEASKKIGNELKRKGGKKTPREETVSEELQVVTRLEDPGVWENITIEKLSDYSNLIDSE